MDDAVSIAGTAAHNLSLDPSLVGVFLGLFAVLVLCLVLCLRALMRQAAALARQKELVDQEGKRRVEKSRSVLLGQVAEHFAPLVPGFPYHPKDARFMGQPVDYLVFNGLHAAQQDAAPGAARQRAAVPEIELVLVEIKSGQSRLSGAEQALKQAVAAGRVRFEVLRLDAAGRLSREGE